MEGVPLQAYSSWFSSSRFEDSLSLKLEFSESRLSFLLELEKMSMLDCLTKAMSSYVLLVI